MAYIIEKLFKNQKGDGYEKDLQKTEDKFSKNEKKGAAFFR
ncbi:MAG TPA: hypothetical protein PLB52_02545 [Candidatus Moranbacteria bacterium]|nr:hypothetical protein [Candidatus Moranbacteria bacterium]